MIPEHLREVAARVRPLRDFVCWVRQEPRTLSGILIPTVQLNRGWVLAIGAGRRMRRKVGVPVAAGQVEYFETGGETGRIRPMTVQPGDFLEFSPNGQTDFEVDGVKLVMSGEKSVMGYADPNTEGAMFPTPNGFDDRNRKVVGKF